MSVELHFGNVTTCIGRTYVAHITETARAVDVGRRQLSYHSVLINYIYGDGIHEVLTVGAFEDSKIYSFRSLTIVARRPRYTGNDVGCAQVETYPRKAAVPRSKECGEVTVKGILTGVHRSRRSAGVGVIDGQCSTYDGASQTVISEGDDGEE